MHPLLKKISLLIIASAFSSLANEKPNIVIIYTDDLGYGDLSCYGATKVKTPHIDKLASEGKRFTDAHVASAVCTPSRYALLTGNYPHRVPGGLKSPIFMKAPLCFDKNTATIASLLKGAGYTTACIGKWHLGFTEDKIVDWNKPLKPGPRDLGFDYFYGLPVVNSHPPFVYVENESVVGADPADPFTYKKFAKTEEIAEKRTDQKFGGGDKAHALYKDYEVGTHLKEKAVEWIEQQAKTKKPFFLYFPTTNIHHPFTPAPQFQGKSEAGIYGDFIVELDWIVGEVVDALEKANVADNTIVVFTSDNGGMLNLGGAEAWKMGHHFNGALGGFKAEAWEGGHRVPFIIKWPNRIKANTVSEQLISNTDLFATFAAITKRNYTEKDALDSLNILPLLTSENAVDIRDKMVIAAPTNKKTFLRMGKWLYIPEPVRIHRLNYRVQKSDLKNEAVAAANRFKHSDIENGKLKSSAPSVQLYDLDADLSQTNNLAKTNPEVVKQMQAVLREQMKMKRTAPVIDVRK